MKSGLILFVLLLFSTALDSSATSYLEFIEPGFSINQVENGDDTYSTAIYATDPIVLGSSYDPHTERNVYISTNGYFSLGTTPSEASLTRFSSSQSHSIIAPFAADIDTKYNGYVPYYIFTTGTSYIETVDSYIRSELGVSFYGTWMLVAEWRDVAQYGGSSHTSAPKTNRFQGIIITDRYSSSSYAVFLYDCRYMEWSGNAVIGWQAGSSYYRNHPLSGSNNARDIACSNTANSYSTVIFQLSRVSVCNSLYFGCFNGLCSPFSSARCDGYQDCSDGSDEIHCFGYSSFLDLTDSQTVSKSGNSYSSAEDATDDIVLGSSSQRSFYVSANGYFSLGSVPPGSSLNTFSSSQTYFVVAPFAADVWNATIEFVDYSSFPAGNSNLSIVSSFIASQLNVQFDGTWMVVADWYQDWENNNYDSDTNRFQGIIITDGHSSYALFLYFCPYMERYGSAVIGWQAGSSYYRNHPLSGNYYANKVACLNGERSHNTVIFKLSGASSCGSSFGCFNGECVSSSSTRCNGRKGCSDGSDEVACSYTCSSFQCSSGVCKPQSIQCDGTDDCGDSSDENGCDICSSDEFHCNNNKCIPKGKLCDKYDDCEDNSDENDCPGEDVCSSDEFHCSNNKCIPKGKLCDKYDDCEDNSDENDCPGEGIRTLIMDLSISISSFLFSIIIILCIICIVCCCMARKRKMRRPVSCRVVTNTSSTASPSVVILGQTRFPGRPASQQQYPLECSPETPPPPYPGPLNPAQLPSTTTTDMDSPQKPLLDQPLQSEQPRSPSPPPYPSAPPQDPADTPAGEDTVLGESPSSENDLLLPQ